ncbi:hypothetical protein JR316_0009459 [Psilocybe cubensis]|uniref:Uncharacterized protein n=2 Tax=Psilocybe cubensis TaxID=181762 RepID=A0ACB8GU44_PSICU|nr:hypothetical protein JR316_0009459 [Psilocybe cubensis]KAH9478995.1 hypothetical protein JR316_0009459 [Psilocybe cubensis]
MGSASTFTSLFTTVTATFLIAYRIYPVSRTSGRSRTRYMHIITTIVESSMVYSLCLLLQTLAGTIPAFSDFESIWSEVTEYIGLTLNITSGLAPTVMVLRLALVDTSDTVESSTVAHISGINFEKSNQNGDVLSGIDVTSPKGESSARDEGGEANLPLVTDQIIEQRREGN